jgi:hypothetical protein
MKQFDEKFRQQAKDAFIGYDADRLADAGWNAFVQKRKRRGIAGIIIPMWAKAASVAILLTTGSLITYRLMVESPDTVLEYGAVAEEVNPSGAGPGEQSMEIIAGEAVVVREGIVKPAGAAGDPGSRQPGVEAATGGRQPGAETDTGSRHLIVKQESVVAPLIAFDEQMVVAPDTVRKIEEKAAGADREVKAAEMVVAEALEVIVPEEPEIELSDDPVQRTRKTFFMAGLSGSMAQSEEVSSGVPGLSFGVYGEHKISRRWAVRPGVVLAMQSVGLGSPTAEKNMSYMAPALDGAAGSVESFDGSLNMLAVEVPVNFVYTIMERGKKGLYISAGASTMVYLAQNVSGSFTNSYKRESLNTTTGEVASETRYSSVSVESSEDPLSHTDFLGLANISAGYSMPFGKSSRLLIEPYMQLPVNTLTSLNLRIRYGGVSMKIRFGK